MLNDQVISNDNRERDPETGTEIGRPADSVSASVVNDAIAT